MARHTSNAALDYPYYEEHKSSQKPQKTARLKGESAYELAGAHRARAVARLKALAFLIFLFGAAFLIITRYVAIYEGGDRVARLNKQYNDLVSANNILQMQIDRSVDLKTVEDVATNKLGMRRPDKYQIFYINMNMGDHGEKIAAGDAQNSLTGVPGVLIQALGGENK